MYRNKILSTTLLGIISTIFPQKSMAEAVYQCVACPSNTFAKKGSVGLENCIHITNLDTSFFSNKYETLGGQTCLTGKVKRGYPYKVVLAGGNGGNCSSGSSRGGKGGYLEYNFIAHADGDFELCAGQRGYANNEGAKYLCGYERFYKSGAGGGAGSFLRLNFGENDYYFAAGGGGGCLHGADNSAGGGGGGGIGAGGAGGVGGKDADSAGAAGGSIVGKYSGGAEKCPYDNGANPGDGLVKGVASWSWKQAASGGGNGGNGGRSPHSAPTTQFFTYTVNGPDSATSKKLGGDGGGVYHWSGYDGTTSVGSNVSASFSQRSDGQGFAYLYYLE